MLDIIKIALKKQKYLLWSLIAGLAMFAISYYLTIINISGKSLFIFAEMNGYWFTLITMLFSLIISAIFGVYISLLIFKKDIAKNIKSRTSKAGGIGGTTFGILASGCPSCGAPLLGLIGFPLGLFALPFGGLEIKLLSIALLSFSLYLIVKSIKENLHCKV